MANTNTVLNTRAQGDSNTDYAAATPAGAKGFGNVAQYGGGNSAAETAATQSITPAGPYISKGTNDSIIGTVPPGKPGIPQIRTVINRATDLKVSSASISGSSNEPDNVLTADWAQVGSSATSGVTGAEGNVTPNPAQQESAGKSLAPGHE